MIPFVFSSISWRTRANEPFCLSIELVPGEAGDAQKMHGGTGEMHGAVQESLQEICARLGGGIRLSTKVVGIPQGSGLGTSSILSGACVKGLFRFLGREATDDEIYAIVLADVYKRQGRKMYLHDAFLRLMGGDGEGKNKKPHRKIRRTDGERKKKRTSRSEKKQKTEKEWYSFLLL